MSDQEKYDNPQMRELIIKLSHEELIEYTIQGHRVSYQEIQKLGLALDHYRDVIEKYEKLKELEKGWDKTFFGFIWPILSCSVLYFVVFPFLEKL